MLIPHKCCKGQEYHCTICQGLLVPIELELEATDIVKMDIWTHNKL